MSATAAATFCATLVDEWVRARVGHAVVAPGSRSTPLALALVDRAEIAVHVVLDERSAAFCALGIGVATGRPTVLVCTSGTAAAELHAAVVEAHQAEVPIVVCTADRPPELRDVAAPQTIDQARLFGTAVRWYCDPGPPTDDARGWWRSIAARSVADAMKPVPGPVHLNLPFRDPLVGDPGPVPDGRPGGQPWHEVTAGTARLDEVELVRLAAVLERQRGVIVSGAGSGDPNAVHQLAARAGWPVLADPRSCSRLPRPTTVAAFDALLRHERFAADHTPEVVLRLGRPPASKVVAQWLAGSGATQVQVTATPAWVDPEHTAAHRVVADPTATCCALADRVRGATGTPWLARWQSAERRAQDALDGALAARSDLSEPAVARRTLAAMPEGATLVVSSSMPVRDVEWYGRPRDGVHVVANRGANGIDGVVSTALGVALGTRRPTGLLIGDLALLHDTNGLLALAAARADLRIVVVDNDGGGIFSFLPQASALPVDRFEQLFGTPQGVDPLAVAAAHGVPVRLATCLDDVDVVLGDPGPVVLRVVTDRSANVAAHTDLHDAVRRALG